MDRGRNHHRSAEAARAPAADGSAGWAATQATEDREGVGPSPEPPIRSWAASRRQSAIGALWVETGAWLEETGRPHYHRIRKSYLVLGYFMNHRFGLRIASLLAWTMIFSSGGWAGDCRTLLYATNGAETAGTGQTYSTLFPASEKPLSEGGCWINGKTVGLDWADVVTSPGMAFGKDLPTQYADPTAVLTGTWGPDQEAEARIRVERRLSGCCREVELRLRTTIAPHSTTGYEIMCSVASTHPYLNIARWNGPLNDFTPIGKAKIGCADGDVLKATVLGDTITVYRNSFKVLETKDSQFPSGGSPGIGFWDTTNNIWRKMGFLSWQAFGFSSFSARDNLSAGPEVFDGHRAQGSH